MLVYLLSQTLMKRPDDLLVPLQIVSLAALVHCQFHMDKAPPQPPYQTHFCGQTFKLVLSVCLVTPQML